MSGSMHCQASNVHSLIRVLSSACSECDIELSVQGLCSENGYSSAAYARDLTASMTLEVIKDYINGDVSYKPAFDTIVANRDSKTLHMIYTDGAEPGFDYNEFNNNPNIIFVSDQHSHQQHKKNITALSRAYEVNLNANSFLGAIIDWMNNKRYT